MMHYCIWCPPIFCLHLWTSSEVTHSAVASEVLVVAHASLFIPSMMSLLQCGPRIWLTVVVHVAISKLLYIDFDIFKSWIYVMFNYKLFPFSLKLYLFMYFCWLHMYSCIVVWGFGKHFCFYKHCFQFLAWMRLLKIFQTGAIINVSDILVHWFNAAFCCSNVNITTSIWYLVNTCCC